MSVNTSFARGVRLRRIHRHRHDRLFVVPLDHSISDGPLRGDVRLGRLVATLSGSGVDAVVLHKGGLRHVAQDSFTNTSLILHLSASTRHAPDPDAKYLVASVEESLRLGADAVSVHVNIGSDDERHQVRDLALVAEACDRWNMPLLAMMYPRGPQIDNPSDPGLVAHTATLASDLGADVAKIQFPGSAAALADIVSTCPIPLVTAGGSRLGSTAAVLSHVHDVLSGGAAGVAMGRNVFGADDPAAVARAVADLIHHDSSAADIRELVTMKGA